MANASGLEISAKMFGAKELEDALKLLPTTALKKSVLRTALKKAAKPVVTDAKKNVLPISKRVARRVTTLPPPKKRRRKDIVQLEIGTPRAKGPKGEGFIGLFFEFGTSKMAARPWLRPAWDKNREQVLKSISGEIGKSLERTAARLASKAARGKLGSRLAQRLA